MPRHNNLAQSGKRFALARHFIADRWVWPFKDMEVGDWFIVRADDVKRTQRWISARACEARRHGTFATQSCSGYVLVVRTA
jgi:hypothetical protein